jgi:RHS repeat-associated protein
MIRAHHTFVIHRWHSHFEPGRIWVRSRSLDIGAVFARRNFTLLGLAFVLASLLPAPSTAQIVVGTPPFGTYGGGPFDTINIANLNAHMIIPVVHKSGRGMPFNFDLAYDTSIWQPVTSNGIPSWQPANSWGWASSDLVVGYVTYQLTITQGCFGTDGSVGYNYTYTNWTYFDGTFTPHRFPLGSYAEVPSSTGQCSNYSGSGGAPSAASDLSGYTLSPNGSNATLTTSEGTFIVAPINPSSPSTGGSLQDRNGNQISLNYKTFTDSVGAKVLIGNAPAPPAATTWSYTPPSMTGTSGTVSVTKSFKTYTVQTNFGCSGIKDYGSAQSPKNIPLVDRVTLPDGSFYQFYYEQTVGAATGTVTGRLASVTLPTGGIIRYTYSSNSPQFNGISCVDGSALGLQRNTPDGNWSYSIVSPSPLYNDPATKQVTIVDPQNNTTVMSFRYIYETDRSVYQGAATPANLLQSTKTCYTYAGSPAGCSIPVSNGNFYARYVTTTLPGGLQSAQSVRYNSYGGITEIDDYDYGSGGTYGALLRKKLIAYAPLGNNIHVFRQTETLQDGNNNTLATTTYNYDESTPTNGPAPTTQWVQTAGPWGNLTSVVYPVSGLKKTFDYYYSGLVRNETDVNGVQTGHSYGACSESYLTLTQQVLPSYNLTRSSTWDCYGGVPLQFTDENGQNTATAYSDASFWRPASITDETGGVTNFSYPNPTQVEAALNFNSGNSTADVLLTLDGLGRRSLVQKRLAPGSLSFDSAETFYDGLGRASGISLAYAGSAGQPAPGPATVAAYDALGRITKITDAAGGVTQYAYIQNDLLITIGPQTPGENLKQRQLEYDGLGRLTSVCEVTNGAGSGRCGQKNSQTGYLTKYTYDALGNLLTVTQNAQAPSAQWQSRSYAYDAMSRLLSENNPESGTVTYTYDTDPTCGTYLGDLVKRVDAVGNTTCFAYDKLHRVTSKTYSGPYSASNKYFVYDSATVNSVVMANAKGHLAEAYTATCSTCTKITDLGFSYSPRGEVTDAYELTPNTAGGYFHITQNYWPNGELQQLSGIPLLPTLSYSLDGEGRRASVSDSSGNTHITNTTYNLLVSPPQMQITFGSGTVDTYTFDMNSARMTNYQFNVGGQSMAGSLVWNANGTLGQLAITDPFNSAGTQTCSYSHDDLVRLQNANCLQSGNTLWSQSFSYDSFGNLSKSGSMSFQPVYSDAAGHTTNRYVSLPGVSASYDANGNLLNDGLHSYTWDAESRMLTMDSSVFTYDALSRPVLLRTTSYLCGLTCTPVYNYSNTFYAPTGEKLGTYSNHNGTATSAKIPLVGNTSAIYNYSVYGKFRSQVVSYTHGDWLGSIRLSSSPTNTALGDVSYAPFGEQYSLWGSNGFLSFAGMDAGGPEYGAQNRWFPIQSRWISPDPAGLSAIDPSNPQSWNRYTYALNNPLALTDPSGLACEVWSDDAGGYVLADAATPDACAEINGFWIDPVIDSVEVRSDPPPSDTAQWLMDWWSAFKQIDAQPLAVRLNRCAQKRTNELYKDILGDNRAVQAVLGNSISALTQLATGPDRLDAGIDVAADPHIGLGGLGLQAATQAVGQIPVLRGTTIYAIDLGVDWAGKQQWGTIIERYVARRVSDLPAFGKLLGKWHSALDGKLLADGIIYLTEEGVCAWNGK